MDQTNLPGMDPKMMHWMNKMLLGQLEKYVKETSPIYLAMEHQVNCLELSEFNLDAKALNIDLAELTQMDLTSEFKQCNDLIHCKLSDYMLGQLKKHEGAHAMRLAMHVAGQYEIDKCVHGFPFNKTIQESSGNMK